MRALSLAGPWAELERRQRQQECIIQQLTSELNQWQAACQERDEQLRAEQGKLREMEESRLPDVKNQLESAKQTIAQLLGEVERHQAAAHQVQQSSAAAVAVLQEKLDTASGDNHVLRAELSKAVQLRQVTHSKVEEARRKLGLGHSEAEFFIKDLDETKAANKGLRAEVASLSQDKARLEQQCDSRSTHAMTLIAENRRLIEQVSELRRQAVSADQDIWRLKQDLAAAQKVGAKAAKRREALATASQARPEWQAGPTRPPSTSGAAPPPVPSATTPSRSPGQDITNCSRTGPARQLQGAVGVSKGMSSVQGLTAQYQQISTVGNQSVDSQTKASDPGTQHGPASSLTRQRPPLNQPGRSVRQSKAGGAAAATVVAVQQAAEQLEELRKAAMQQALACRQQRLVQGASGQGV